MKPTLGQTFALSLLGLTAVLALLFFIVFAGLRDTLLQSAERVRDGASREISDRVSAFLGQAPGAAELFQRAVKQGLVNPHESISIERALFALMMSNRDVGELTLTYGDSLGFDGQGNIRLAPAPRGELSAVRSFGQAGEDRLWSRSVHQEGGRFVADRRLLGEGVELAALPLQREPAAKITDPTTHLTFITPASKRFSGRGQLLWSDLHWSQLDADLPEAQRRVEVSVQQAMTDASGKFVGVLRVGLLAQRLDLVEKVSLGTAGGFDPHRIFICDHGGRLITRLAPEDRLIESGRHDLRISPANLPPEVKAALALPELRAVSEANPVVSKHFRSGHGEFLTTFRALAGTQDWLVGIVVPQGFYLGKLVAMRDRLLTVLLGAMLLLVAAGSLILRAVKRAQAQITRESLKMNAFEFAPAPTGSAFRDVSAVLESLEKAKTAMRAMGKYVPIDLVRRLYREKSEPQLGGELMEISTMFSDIKDFTAFSEARSPDEIANALGRYLDTMARAIQETRGTIDKYIGDGIMTLWNAPEPVPGHACMACRAALRCREAGRELARTPAWSGLPAFETRFGLHRGPAMVGHFGAHDRMNYTAIGDTINLASRLEGLNKQYGTAIVASEQIVAEAKEEFDFRLLDLVAVKGKTEAIRIYELLGEKGAAEGMRAMLAAYEEALAAYAAGDFARALLVLKDCASDPPSAVLMERCRAFQQTPPPADWRGVYVSLTK